MTAFDSFHWGGRPSQQHSRSRRASARDDAKLVGAGRAPRCPRYVVYRDSLVVKQEADGPRPLLGIEKRSIRRQSGTIFLGLRDGAAFPAWVPAAAVEKLLPATTSPLPNCVAWRCRAWCARPALGNRAGQIDG